MKAIADLTTAELVAEYNALTGKSIKKFSSRAAGEKQVANARAAASPKPAAKKKKEQSELPIFPVQDQSYFYMAGHEAHCPVCGTTEVFSGEGDGAGAVKNEDVVGGCHHCGWEFDLRKNKKPVNPVRSAGISDSWNNPEVAEKRSRRDNVKVDGKGEFRSVKQAFEHLGLPLNQHIKFRMELKEKGAMSFSHNGTAYKFKIV